MKSNWNKTNNQSQGITLIALVITIIVLLILAGVTLGLVFNSDGLFEKANSAASKYNKSKEEELDFLQKADEYLNKYNGIYGESSGTGTQTPTPEPTLPAKGEEPPEEGWTVEQAKGLVERDGLKEHLGEKVQYNPTGGGTWRIFYYDNENDGSGNGYFGELNTLYLKRDYDYTNRISVSAYTNHIPSDNGAITKKMNPKWAISSNGSSLDQINEHCVAWLCDSEVWDEKYKIEGITDYAVGGPSIEMYMKAYNVYKDNNPNSTTLINKIGNANGYSLGAQNSYTFNDADENATGNNSIEPGPNDIFVTEGPFMIWWIASPSSYASDYIITIFGERLSTGFQDYKTELVACPIVAIS